MMIGICGIFKGVEGKWGYLGFGDFAAAGRNESKPEQFTH